MLLNKPLFNKIEENSTLCEAYETECLDWGFIKSLYMVVRQFGRKVAENGKDNLKSIIKQNTFSEPLTQLKYRKLTANAPENNWITFVIWASNYRFSRILT